MKSIIPATMEIEKTTLALDFHKCSVTVIITTLTITDIFIVSGNIQKVFTYITYLSLQFGGDTTG